MSYQIGPISLSHNGDLFTVRNSSRGDFNSVKFTCDELLRLRALMDAAIADHCPARRAAGRTE